MKKSLSIIFLLSLTIILLAPIITLADTQNCCRMGISVTIDGVLFPAGDLVGEVPVPPNLPNQNCLDNSGVSIGNINVADSRWGMACILNTMDRVTNWAFTLLLGVAVLFIIFAAFNFIFAQGDPEKVKSAKEFLLYALIGVIIALLSRGLVGFMQTLVGS